MNYCFAPLDTHQHSLGAAMYILGGRYLQNERAILFSGLGIPPSHDAVLLCTDQAPVTVALQNIDAHAMRGILWEGHLVQGRISHAMVKQEGTRLNLQDFANSHSWICDSGSFVRSVDVRCSLELDDARIDTFLGLNSSDFPASSLDTNIVPVDVWLPVELDVGGWHTRATLRLNQLDGNKGTARLVYLQPRNWDVRIAAVHLRSSHRFLGMASWTEPRLKEGWERAAQRFCRDAGFDRYGCICAKQVGDWTQIIEILLGVQSFSVNIAIHHRSVPNVADGSVSQDRRIGIENCWLSVPLRICTGQPDWQSVTSIAESEQRISDCFAQATQVLDNAISILTDVRRFFDACSPEAITREPWTCVAYLFSPCSIENLAKSLSPSFAPGCPGLSFRLAYGVTAIALSFGHHDLARQYAKAALADVGAGREEYQWQLDELFDNSLDK